MHRSRVSSKRRYAEYKVRRARHDEPTELPDPGAPMHNRRRSRSIVELLGHLWRLIRGQRRGVVFALVTLSAATGASLVMPYAPKILIDFILTDKPGPAGAPYGLGFGGSRVAMLWALGGALLVTTLISVAFGMWGRWLMTSMRMKLQASLRRKAFEHASRLPLHRVHSIRSGGLASLLRDDAAGAGDLLFSLVYNPWRAILQFLGTLVILATIDWRLPVAAIALVPVVFFTHRTWINRIRPVYRDIRRTRQGIDAQSTEVFGGMRVVRAFNREHGESARFVRATHFMVRQEMLAWWRSRAVEVAWQLVIPVSLVAVMVYGGVQVIRGNIEIGDLMAFYAYLGFLLSPLETLASTATQVQTSLAGFDRTLDLLEEPTEFAVATGTRVLDRRSVAGRLTFENVTFRYPDSNEDSAPVLKDINVDARPGEVIALVGSSGAGKTTFCNLVARFFDPTEGTVRLDGVDLREIDLDSYRRLLGVVEQDVFLFDGSIAENIAFSRPGASMEEIVEAARAADADEFIMRFDDQYKTLIGERGVRLSGGQRQRIAIARALLADPRILILDEATSNLDSESERLVQRSLARLMRGRTSFVIAHRLSTIRHADRIVVLDGGEVVEVGSHEELWARGGRYATLLTLQLGERARELMEGSGEEVGALFED